MKRGDLINALVVMQQHVADLQALRELAGAGTFEALPDALFASQMLVGSIEFRLAGKGVAASHQSAALTDPSSFLARRAHQSDGPIVSPCPPASVSDRQPGLEGKAAHCRVSSRNNTKNSKAGQRKAKS